MKNFIFYPNEAFNKNKRIKYLNPLVSSGLVLVSLYHMHSFPTTSCVLLTSAFVILMGSLTHLLPGMKYISFYMVDKNFISYKKNIFSKTEEYRWESIRSITKNEASVSIVLKDQDQNLVVEPDMMSYHDLNLFFQAIEHYSEQNNVQFIND